MKKIISRDVWASEIVEYLGLKLNITDFTINKPCSPKILEEGSITYIPDGISFNINEMKDNVLIIVGECKLQHPNVIKVENPQLQFYKVVNEFFMDDILVEKSVNAFISPDAKLARGVSIGENSYVGGGAIIGTNTVIGRNVYIGANTVIGKDCYIKENAVIGSVGYQFIETKTGYINKPCLGRIIIHDNVLIGSGSTIETPEFDVTEVQSYAKIDDLVNIGSECIIGEKVLIAAGSILCHRVKIGDKTQIGAGSRIREDSIIGTGVTVGIGTVVISNLNSFETYVGNPAKCI